MPKSVFCFASRRCLRQLHLRRFLGSRFTLQKRKDVSLAALQRHNVVSTS